MKWLKVIPKEKYCNPVLCNLPLFNNKIESFQNTFKKNAIIILLLGWTIS